MELPKTNLSEGPLENLPKKPSTKAWNQLEVNQFFGMVKELSKVICKEMKYFSEFELTSIASQLNRTPKYCLFKLREILATGTTKRNNWGYKEDLIIKQEVNSQKRWSQIADKINNTLHLGWKIRNGKQCRDRWRSILNPELNKGPWSEQEDITLLKMYLEYGSQWEVISQDLKFRSKEQMRARIRSLVNLNQKTYEDDTTTLCRVLQKKTESIPY